ncbi:MAG TPA: hypothetical protein VIY47_13465 [Ignavibacteriaceae bacterium]
MDDNLEIFRDEDFDSEKVLTKYDYFEAMDRTYIVFRQLDDLLYNHQGFSVEQARMAQQAFELLFEIYQQAGRKFFDFTENDKNSA